MAHYEISNWNASWPKENEKNNVSMHRLFMVKKKIHRIFDGFHNILIGSQIHNEVLKNKLKKM